MGEFPDCNLTRDLIQKFCEPFSKLKNSTKLTRPPLRVLNLLRNPLGPDIKESLKDLGNIQVEMMVMADCKLYRQKPMQSLLKVFLLEPWLNEGGLRVLNLSLNDIS